MRMLKSMGKPPFLIAAAYLAVGVAWLATPYDDVWSVFADQVPVGHDIAKWLSFVIMSGASLYLVLRWQLARLVRSYGYVRRMHHFVRGIVEHCPLPVVVKDDCGRVVLFNRPAADLIGRAEGKILGEKSRSLVSSDLASRLESIDRLVMQTGTVHEEEMDFHHGDQTRSLRLVRFPIFDENAAVKGTGTFGIDMTEVRQAEAHLEKRLLTDNITGLPNRDFVVRDLPRRIAEAEAGAYDLVLLLISFEGLNLVEATLGPTLADEALVVAIERVKAGIPENALIAHLRGWDILIAYPQLSGIRRPAYIAQSLVAAFQEPVNASGHLVFPTPRISIASYPNDGNDSETLLNKVRTAMRHCTGDELDSVHFAVPEQGHVAQRRLAIENQLRNALERGEFFLNYQAQVATVDERVVGAEALLRWRNPQLGLVPPSEFIPIAEETGLIRNIERWALETACREAQAWSECGGQDVRVAVNVTATQFLSQEFVRFVSKTLRETGLPARRLEIEITERLLLQASKAVRENLNWLSKLQVTLAIDDFGTGYSSLRTLKMFPFDVVKIDKSFIDNIADDPDDGTITKAVIGMARTLGLETVAEGVEEEAQRDILRKLGVNVMQGYLYSRPVSGYEIRRLIRRRSDLPLDRVPDRESATSLPV